MCDTAESLLIFYVYELRDDSGVVFYVGKGKGDRTAQHAYSAKSGKKGHLYNYIRKLWQNGRSYKAHKIAENLSEKEAFALEKKLIAAYGRKTLTNKTDGGEGGSGVIFSASRKAKISKALKGRKLAPHLVEQMKQRRANGLPEETREKISKSLRGRKLPAELVERMRGRKQSPESVAKRANSNRGKKRHPDFGKKISEKLKGRVFSAETRQKMSQARRGAVTPAKTREKLRKLMCERMAIPEVKESLRKKLLGRKMSEENRKLLSLRTKGKKLTEEHRAKISAAAKGRVVSEATREKLRKSYTGNQWGKKKIANSD